MNNTQKFIIAEFNYISDNVTESSKVFKPCIVISHGRAKTKYIDITWEQMEQIKQLLIETSESK